MKREWVNYPTLRQAEEARAKRRLDFPRFGGSGTHLVQDRLGPR